MPLAAAPAQAVGSDCVTTKQAERYAVMRAGDTAYATADINASRAKVRVRIVVVRLRYLPATPVTRERLCA